LRSDRKAALPSGDPLLEYPHLPRTVGDPPAEEADLLLEVGDLAQQCRDVTFTPRSHLVGT
jgi:hypothetical protein